ncbi:MAG: diphthamide biosynthesis enzyme Dph2 [Thermoplasmata archaeon]
MQHYSYDAEKVKRWISREKIRKFAVQVPSGLLSYAKKILEEFSEYGDAVLYGEPSFGACDYPEIENLDVDGVINLGHSEIPGLTKNNKILFLEMYVNSVPKHLDALAEKLNRKLGIFTTVPYLKILPVISKFLRECGVEVYVGKPENRTVYEGQVLGCDVSAALAIAPYVDTYLFIGEGDFHPKGVAMRTSKPVFRYHPSGMLEPLTFNMEQFLRKRFLIASEIEDVRNVAILVCTKPGQRRMALALKTRKILERHGKKVDIIYMNTLTPEKLDYLGYEIIVSTACPRIALEDFTNYRVKLLTPQEALLGINECIAYEVDQFQPAHI